MDPAYIPGSSMAARGGWPVHQGSLPSTITFLSTPIRRHLEVPTYGRAHCLRRGSYTRGEAPVCAEAPTHGERGTCLRRVYTHHGRMATVCAECTPTMGEGAVCAECTPTMGERRSSLRRVLSLLPKERPSLRSFSLNMVHPEVCTCSIR